MSNNTDGENIGKNKKRNEERRKEQNIRNKR